MNELSIVVVMTIAAILWAAVSYSVGYKEGQREGYSRGRAISRHAAINSLKSKAVK
jgi:hypothetical protein